MWYNKWRQAQDADAGSKDARDWRSAMRKGMWLVVQIALAVCARCGWCASGVFEYPAVVLDMYDADQSCWTGIDALGHYPARVLPERWLVGPPLSVESAVTIPADHWLDLAFSGGFVDGDQDDIVLVETGKAGEQALLFLTDGADREYLLTKVVIEPAMTQELSYVGVDLAGVVLPFVPRVIRLVALDMGGESPGFDLAYVQARVSHECGAKACCPSPISGVGGVDPNIHLFWIPGSSAPRHVVYLSDVEAQVEAGDTAVRHGPFPGDVNTFDPAGLQLGTTYYWRVDGLGPAGTDGVCAGDVWSFTVSDHIAVDDFETYTDLSSLWDAWHPKGYAEPGLEQEVVDTCQQSLVFSYYYDATSDSSLSRSFPTAQDWTQSGVHVLQLLLRGDLPDPRSGELYVILTDGARSQTVALPPAVEIEDLAPWHISQVALTDFNEIDLAHICGMGLGVRSVPSTGSRADCRKTLNVAAIGLYGTLCPTWARPQADLTADCRVDYEDLGRIAADWLYQPVRVCETKRPEKPVAWYEFDGNANDRMHRANGLIQGRCDFADGVYGQAIHFTSQGDAVRIGDAGKVFAQIHDAITIAFWQKGDDAGHLNDTLFCTDYTYGQVDPIIAIHLGCWRAPGYYRWDCGSPWLFSSRLAGRHRDKSDWTGRWNHWAFTKDIRTGAGAQKGSMEIYLNGELYDRLTGTDTPITGIKSFEIGSGWYGHYDGLIDDLQIYDYALSPAEIAYAATDGTGAFEKTASPADLNVDDRVDFRDFAGLATDWLQDALWP